VTLGKGIKTIRTALGVKQGVLAKRVGVSQNYLSLLESDKREPSVSFLRRMAKALDVPVGIFFGGEAGFGRTAELRELFVRLEALYLDEKPRPIRRRRRTA